MIRLYKADDQVVLISLLRQNTPEYFAPEEEADFIRYLQLHAADHYVYVEDDQVLGCAGYSWQREKRVGMVSWFLVDQQQQGKGIGRLLLNHTITELRKEALLQKIIVRTSQLVYRFFERSGFVLISTEKDYWAPGFDLYYMELLIR
jgi:GNAT superfamily N-acetyltransferase